MITENLWEDLTDLVPTSGTLNGLAVSEDAKNVYVEAAVPGVNPKDVDVTFEKGVLWVQGETQEEEKNGKKYYRKASSSFSYRVAIPGDVDWNTEPVATCKNGMMTVTFTKSAKMQQKKIVVRAA